MRTFMLVLSLVAAVFTLRTIEAQLASEDCPAIVGEALQQVGNTCSDLDQNTACYAHNEINTTFYGDLPPSVFDEPADTVALVSLHTIETSPLNEDQNTWGLALMNTRANLPNTAPGQQVVMLLMGDAQVENRVSADDARVDAVTATVTTVYASNLRHQPSLNGRVVDSVSAGTPLTVDMRDGEWLRVARQNGSIAWISREVIETTDGLDTLNTPAQRSPMQAFYFTGGIGQARCAEASGTLYIQGPNRVQVDLQVNGAEVIVGSTLALRYVAADTLEFATLSGTVYVDSRPVPAGYALTAQVDDTGTIQPGSFTGPLPMDADQIAYYDLGEQIPASLLHYPITVEAPVISDAQDDTYDLDNPHSDVNVNPSLGGNNDTPGNTGGAPPSQDTDDDDDGNNGNGPPADVGNGNDECTSNGNGNGNGFGNGC